MKELIEKCGTHTLGGVRGNEGREDDSLQTRHAADLFPVQASARHEAACTGNSNPKQTLKPASETIGGVRSDEGREGDSLEARLEAERVIPLG